jgi:hypothetical protein
MVGDPLQRVDMGSMDRQKLEWTAPSTNRQQRWCNVWVHHSRGIAVTLSRQDALSHGWASTLDLIVVHFRRIKFATNYSIKVM